jgi:general secretion pathway protein K
MALIMVLLVLTLLLTIATQFAAAMRLEGTTALNFRATMTAGYLAEAAYARAVAEILPTPLGQYMDPQLGLLVFRRAQIETPKAPEREDIALGPGRFSYRITDEQARINLNQASPDLLHRLLQELSVERSARDVIVDSILDWRDANEAYRLSGAESEYYLGLPVPYRSKNANFDSVDELLQVKGVTPALFYGQPGFPGLAEYLTVIVGSNTVNVNTASALVLRAFDLAPAEVDTCVAARRYLPGTPSRGTPALPTFCQKGNLRIVNSQFYRIEAWGELPGQGRRALTAIVQKETQDNAPSVKLLSWGWHVDGDRP